MTDTYRGGYKKALLDIKTFLENGQLDRIYKTKKQYKQMINNILSLLLENPSQLDTFMQYGGNVGGVIDKDGKILEVNYGPKR